MISTTDRDVTPDWADQILVEHYKRIEAGKFAQRPLTRSLIDRFVADMAAGSWLHTPEAIAFDAAGNLIDGQHRLEAVRRSKRTVKMTVSTGWPISNGAVGIMDVINSGKPRTVGQMMAIHGTKHAEKIVTSLRFILRVAYNGVNATATYSQATHLLNKVGLLHHIERIALLAPTLNDFQGRVIGPLAYYHTVRPQKAIQFATSLFNFETTKGSPIRAFLNWTKDTAHRRMPETYIRALCATIRAWDLGETKLVTYPTREAVEWLGSLNQALKLVIRGTVPPRTKA